MVSPACEIILNGISLSVDSEYWTQGRFRKCRNTHSENINHPQTQPLAVFDVFLLAETQKLHSRQKFIKNNL